MVLDRIADFLRQLLDRHNRIDERHSDMSADLKSIIAQLSDQGDQIAAHGKQIDKLIADRDEKEQADLEQIRELIEANAAAASANAAKMANALVPSTTGQAAASDPSVSITAVVTAPTVATSTVIPVASVSVGDISTAVDAATAAGSSVAVSGQAIADGTTVTAVDPAASTITVSQPTTADHVGDGTEQLTITPPAS